MSPVDNFRKITDYGLSFSNRYMNWKRFYSIKDILRRELKRRDCQGEIRILDIGCWDGRLIYQLKEEFGRQFNIKLFGVDISALDISSAQRKKLNLNIDGCYFFIMDALNLGFLPGGFDIVVSSELIEHIAEPELVIRQVYQVLKPDGVFILTTPNKGGGILAKFFRRLRLKKDSPVFGGNVKTENAVVSGIGNSHISVKTRRQWISIFKEEGFKIIYSGGTGGLLFGCPYLDSHRVIFALNVLLDVILENLAFSHLWSEILLFKLKKRDA